MNINIIDCPICNKTAEISKENLERGSFTCQFCFTVNEIDYTKIYHKEIIKKKVSPPKKILRNCISFLQIAIFTLSIYSLSVIPITTSCYFPLIATAIIYWLEKIKKGYDPFVNDREYEVNPKDLLRQEGFEDPLASDREQRLRKEAEKKAGRQLLQNEWDEKYQLEYPPMELTWESVKNKIIDVKKKYIGFFNLMKYKWKKMDSTENKKPDSLINTPVSKKMH